jgi:hypothetical protein
MLYIYPVFGADKDLHGSDHDQEDGDRVFDVDFGGK